MSRPLRAASSDRKQTMGGDTLFGQNPTWAYGLVTQQALLLANPIVPERLGPWMDDEATST